MLSQWAKNRLRRERLQLTGNRNPPINGARRSDAAPIEPPALGGHPPHDDSRSSKDTTSNKIIAAFTGAMLITSILQWHRAGEQISSSEKIAADNSKDTRAALETSNRAVKAAEQQSKATAKQSRATEQALIVSGRVATAAELQAEASVVASKTGQQQVSLANRQLRQNLDLFAAQQRPIIHVDTASKHSSGPKEIDGEIRWNYGFKNFGAGPAFDVVFYEAISLYGGPFQETRRLGSKMDVPGTSHWSTARYFRPPGDIPAEWPYPTLRVRFEYSDALGKRYSTVSCYQIDANEAVVDCTSAQESRVGQEQD